MRIKIDYPAKSAELTPEEDDFERSADGKKTDVLRGHLLKDGIQHVHGNPAELRHVFLEVTPEVMKWNADFLLRMGFQYDGSVLSHQDQSTVRLRKVLRRDDGTAPYSPAPVADGVTLPRIAPSDVEKEALKDTAKNLELANSEFEEKLAKTERDAAERHRMNQGGVPEKPSEFATKVAKELAEMREADEKFKQAKAHLARLKRQAKREARRARGTAK